MKYDLPQLFEDYKNECRFSACLRPETIRGYKAVFQLFLKMMPEVSSVEFLTEQMLNEFFKRIENRQRLVGKDTIKTGVKKSTIRTQYSKLNVFFKWLEHKKYIEENPLKNIKPPKVNYDDFKRLQDEEIHKIYSAISTNYTDTLTFRRDMTMVSLLIYTGVRKGELIGLRKSDIDLEKKEITIRGETSKSKRTRILSIHPTLVLHLKDYIGEVRRRGIKTEHLLVSSKEDRGLSIHGLKHWVKNLIKKSGVKFHLHQFRHTFACLLTEEGTSLYKLQILMGHSSVNMTTKYLRSLKTQDMAQDIAKISI